MAVKARLDAVKIPPVPTTGAPVVKVRRGEAWCKRCGGTTINARCERCHGTDVVPVAQLLPAECYRIVA